MPYLGRKANAPAYPFILGASSAEPPALLAGLPRARSHADVDEQPTVRLYEVVGDYHSHRHIPLGQVKPPAATREGQLTWASQHLSR